MKPIWASKVVWANVIALVASVSLGLGLDLGLSAEVQATLLAGVMSVVNIILRLITKDAIV